MGIFELFSKRQKRLKGEKADVFFYDKIPNKLRVQVIHIVRDTIGVEGHYNDLTNDTYKQIHDILCREYGVFKLEDGNSYFESIFDYFLKQKDIEKCLDIIELSFRIIDSNVRNDWRFRECEGVKQVAEDAILELNQRFLENDVGYHFESGEIIRIDSKIVHSEVVKPVLHLLGSDSKFRGANEEFLKAHEHYRHKRYKECLVDCLKSFESIMIAICKKRGWTYSERDTASKLINTCFENDLVPSYLQSQFSAIRSLLESGIPTVRNREGGHGQGTDITDIVFGNRSRLCWFSLDAKVPITQPDY